MLPLWYKIMNLTLQNRGIPEPRIPALALSPKSLCETSIFPSNCTTTASHQHFHASLMWLWLHMPTNYRICFFVVCKRKKWQVSKMAYSFHVIGKDCFVCSHLGGWDCPGGRRSGRSESLPTDKPPELAEASPLHHDWEKEGGEKKSGLKETQHKKKASDNTWPRIMKPERKAK